MIVWSASDFPLRRFWQIDWHDHTDKLSVYAQERKQPSVKPPSITPEQIQELGPPCFETIARADWTDRNEHMNIRFFVVVFDDAGDAFYTTVGLSDADHRRRESGTMDLEHHIYFLREVLPGDRLAVYLRIVGVSAKRFHYVMFLLNTSTGQLASAFECVNTFVDLTQRKTAPWPEEVRSALQSLCEAHNALPWQPPLCGSMSA
jgi:acyl-CoA thioester hydrolase